jgi:AbrB family looped-hinge helix DNA binding protein
MRADEIHSARKSTRKHPRTSSFRAITMNRSGALLLRFRSLLHRRLAEESVRRIASQPRCGDASPHSKLGKAAILDPETSKEDDFSMTTTVTRKNMVTIPAEVGRKLGIKPGWKLDWQPIEGKEEILVRVIPDRGERARRLLGAGRKFSPERDAVSELVAERAAEG